MKDFCNWSDKSNYGITHLGVNYDELKIEDICNDILHQQLSVTRKIISFIRDYLESYSFEIRDKFVKVLKQH